MQAQHHTYAGYMKCTWKVMVSLQLRWAPGIPALAQPTGYMRMVGGCQRHLPCTGAWQTISESLPRAALHEHAGLSRHYVPRCLRWLVVRSRFDAAGVASHVTVHSNRPRRTPLSFSAMSCSARAMRSCSVSFMGSVCLACGQGHANGVVRKCITVRGQSPNHMQQAGARHITN